MRASFAILAAAAATVSAQQYGPISQISDGQIQNPTTPVVSSAVASATSVVASLTSAAPVASSVASAYSSLASVASSVSVVIPPIVSVGTGVSSGAAVPTGPYSNGTTVATSAKGSSSASASKSAAASASATGAASAQQVGSFGLAAAVAALFLA